jgi:cation-transporting ATPase I
VQTPIVSGFFDCRPLGPLGWATALGTAALATGGALVAPHVAAAVESSTGLVAF